MEYKKVKTMENYPQSVLIVIEEKVDGIKQLVSYLVEVFFSVRVGLVHPEHSPHNESRMERMVPHNVEQLVGLCFPFYDCRSFAIQHLQTKSLIDVCSQVIY